MLWVGRTPLERLSPPDLTNMIGKEGHQISFHPLLVIEVVLQSQIRMADLFDQREHLGKNSGKQLSRNWIISLKLKT